MVKPKVFWHSASNTAAASQLEIFASRARVHVGSANGHSVRVDHAWTEHSVGTKAVRTPHPLPIEKGYFIERTRVG